MDRKKKILAAISAAIAKYLEEEAAALQMTMQPHYPQPVIQQTPTPSFSAWALSGRLTHMERRFNMQYRFNR